MKIINILLNQFRLSVSWPYSLCNHFSATRSITFFLFVFPLHSCRASVCVSVKSLFAIVCVVISKSFD